MRLIKSFQQEKFFQYIFVKFVPIVTTIRRTLSLSDKWRLEERDVINAHLGRWQSQPSLEVDSGLIDDHENIIPIELETVPGTYTLVQVPNYCYRARYNSYRLMTGIELHEIRTLLVAIHMEQQHIQQLEGACCDVRALCSPDPEHELDVRDEENPVLSALQDLYRAWSGKRYETAMYSPDIPYIGKVFISSWILEVGDESLMAEIEAEVKRIVEKEFGSEENFVKRALDEDGEILRLFSPEQMRFLTTEQISALTPEQLSALSDEQVKSLTPEQLSALSPEQISSLSGEQVKSLTSEQLSALSPEQISSLSGEQVRHLSIEQLENIPIEKLEEVIRRIRERKRMGEEQDVSS